MKPHGEIIFVDVSGNPRTMQSAAMTVKTRFRDAAAARKKGDLAAVKSRGAEVLRFMRKSAKGDLEALEAGFLEANGPAIAKLIERVSADSPEPLAADG